MGFRQLKVDFLPRAGKTEPSALNHILPQIFKLLAKKKKELPAVLSFLHIHDHKQD